MAQLFVFNCTAQQMQLYARMSSVLHSHRAQLVGTALAAAATTAALLSLYATLSKQSKPHELQTSSTKMSSQVSSAPTFGHDAMAKIRAGHVVLVGCGGVGSWAAVMLVRLAIGHIRLVDFDYVTLSSLNRHATASLADVGTPKVRCVARVGGGLLEDADWAIDAIDNIQTKVDLLYHCHSRGIKVFSSIGAGTSRTRYTTASHASCERVYGASYPPPPPPPSPLPPPLLPPPPKSASPSSTPPKSPPSPSSPSPTPHSPTPTSSLSSDWRVHILPVLGPLPALFGLHIATYVLCELAGKPIERPMAVRGGGRSASSSPKTEDDVALLFDDVHRGRSVVPPHRVPVKPMLVWWDHARPLGLENVVVLDVGEAARHEGGGASSGPAVAKKVELKQK
ncbi:hypothetical protein B0H12DRAFT_1328810 [Mycena haematopus]|nr:hypothetical protein B0H12DRAFT_1328810 [Mycena haematopus]